MDSNPYSPPKTGDLVGAPAMRLLHVRISLYRGLLLVASGLCLVGGLYDALVALPIARYYFPDQSRLYLNLEAVFLMVGSTLLLTECYVLFAYRRCMRGR
jgi:hypothetical protein